MSFKAFRRVAFFLILSAGLVVLTGRALIAQTTEGAISGTVRDQSGAVVPGAKVTATNLETSVQSTITSGGDGHYLFQNMGIGNYRVTATATGFATTVRTPVLVSTASTTTLDFVLKPGKVTQQVQVTGAAPLLQTASAALSTVVPQREVTDLPLELGGNNTGSAGRRQVDNFLFLTPGVTGNQFSKSFNGSAELTSQIYADGVPFDISVTPGVWGNFSPPFEAVQEFAVQPAVYPAEYGGGFGVQIYSLKSGTDQFHGDLFEFLRNDALDARGFFNTTKPIIRQNEFGATLGGPVIIPHLYNGKGKTFFFGSYSGFRLVGGSPNLSYTTLPTVQMKNGDFSQLTPLGINVYDPATTVPDGSGGFVRQQISCNGALNVICPGRFDSVSKQLLPLIPNPDINQPFNNFFSRQVSTTDSNLWSLRLDHQLSRRQKVSFSYWWSHTTQPNTGPLRGTQLADGFLAVQKGGAYRLNDYLVLTPNLVNHLGLGYDQRESNRVNLPEVTQDGISLLQIPGLPTGLVGYPCFNISQIATLGNLCNYPDYEYGHFYALVDTLSWTTGKHQISFGGDVRIMQENIENTGLGGSGGYGGGFSFSNLETSQPDAPDVSTQGFGFASFLLGQAHFGGRLLNPVFFGYRNKYFAGFIQDTYRVTPKLTLDFGLRVEHPKPYSEAFDRLSGLSLSAPNPGAGGRPGALVYAGSGPNHIGSNTFTSAHFQYGPRFGLAYRLTHNTVIRSSYGLIYGMGNANAQDGTVQGALSQGFQLAQSLTSLNEGVTPGLILNQGFTGLPVPQLPIVDPSLANGGGIDYYNQDGGLSPYLSAWTVDVQHEFAHGWLVDAAYVGQKATHLSANLENLNQVPASDLSLGSLLLDNINSSAAQAAGIPVPYPGFTGSVAQALRPFPQYTGINDFYQPTGNSTYNALQLKVQKRYTSGLSLLVAYTLSKTITDTSQGPFAVFNATPLDTARRSLQKAIAPNDQTSNLVTSFVYELPFGPGKRFATHNKVLGQVVGGWQASGVLHYASGSPLGVGGGPPLPIFGGGNRPNQNLSVPIRTSVSGGFDPAVDRYLNINAFSDPAPFTFGTVGPRLPSTRGFAQLNEDLSLIKRFPITESKKLEFRVETFNTFNRVIFSNPATNIDNPATYGVVSGQSNSPRVIQFAMKLIF